VVAIVEPARLTLGSVVIPDAVSGQVRRDVPVWVDKVVSFPNVAVRVFVGGFP